MLLSARPDDPRVQHAITLEVGHYGEVIKQVSIGYGRDTSPLETEFDRAAQTTTLITATDTTYTKPLTDPAAHPSDHRTPLPADSRTMELTGFGNRALLFSQFVGLVEGAARRLREAGLRVVVLTGQTPAAERADLVASFQRGEHDVFCISLKAGGTGINLTHANYVVHVDPWWNPAVEEQATARAHRMGQREPVTVYRLVSRGTIEEAILELHARKRDLASAILDGTSAAQGLDDDDLFDLVRFAGAPA